MNFSLETLIAFKYLRSRRNEGFISVSSLFSFLGIMIGVATLIIVMSVMNGFRFELINKIVGVNGHAIVYLNDNTSNNIIDIVEDIENLNNIGSVVKELEVHGMISNKKNSSGVVIKGIDKVDLYERNSIAENIAEGDIKSFEGKNIILGIRMAKYLGVKINDSIKIMTSATTETPFGAIPVTDSFRVIGIFDVGMYEFDKNILFMPRTQAQILTNGNREISHLEIFFINNDLTNETTQNIFNLIKNYGTVFNWESIHKELFNALKIEKKVMFLILSLIIFVAAFNLISSIIMIVKDKEKGIGILRSLGVSKSEILRIFILIGSFVGLLGTFIGSIVGLIISYNISSIQIFLENLFDSRLFAPEIYFFNIIPSKTDSSEVVTIIIIALFLSVLSTIYPAWKATKIEPANTLRYE